MIPAKSLPPESMRAPELTFRRRQYLGRRRRLNRFARGWVFLIALGLLVASRFSSVASAGYQVDRLSSAVNQAKTQDRQLAAEVEELQSAGRLAAAAYRHGLITPTKMVEIGGEPSEAVQPAKSRGPAWRVALRYWGREIRNFLGEL